MWTFVPPQEKSHDQKRSEDNNEMDRRTPAVISACEEMEGVEEEGIVNLEWKMARMALEDFFEPMDCSEPMDWEPCEEDPEPMDCSEPMDWEPCEEEEDPMEWEPCC